MIWGYHYFWKHPYVEICKVLSKWHVIDFDRIPLYTHNMTHRLRSIEVALLIQGVIGNNIQFKDQGAFEFTTFPWTIQSLNCTTACVLLVLQYILDFGKPESKSYIYPMHMDFESSFHPPFQQFPPHLLPRNPPHSHQLGHPPRWPSVTNVSLIAKKNIRMENKKIKHAFLDPNCRIT